MEFTGEDIIRYSRNILLPEVGARGQEKIREGKVLVVGAGGIGSPVILYLAAAGVGRLGIIDGDKVELSNLQRQVVHFTGDVGRSKTASAAVKARALNPGVEVVEIDERLSAGNAAGIISGYDFVVEGSDNFETKYLVNDACAAAGKAFCTGGLSRFEGQAMTRVPGAACYRCLFPEEGAGAETCAMAGVLGAVAGITGTILAAEALKYLSGAGELLTNSLLSFDARTMHFRRLEVRRRPGCASCGDESIKPR
ncbi:MAG: HesA/MoeB/ThiF family protein [Odoribacteraceae bacterium]|jgi:adenylyltransferase/sulfurtransferase|nr:HesA/MoeB/ThiF family protein [Odoribacteraceae bacterium]